jgi:hypothetical protein
VDTGSQSGTQRAEDVSAHAYRSRDQDEQTGETDERSGHEAEDQSG